jgi:hypothetical protein
MSKKERLSKEIDSLREKRQNIFTILFGVLSAIAIVVYAVVSGEKPFFMVTFGVVGCIGVAYLSLLYAKIDDEINIKLDELEKEE